LDSVSHDDKIHITVIIILEVLLIQRIWAKK